MFPGMSEVSTTLQDFLLSSASNVGRFSSRVLQFRRGKILLSAVANLLCTVMNRIYNCQVWLFHHFPSICALSATEDLASLNLPLIVLQRFSNVHKRRCRDYSYRSTVRPALACMQLSHTRWEGGQAYALSSAT